MLLLLWEWPHWPGMGSPSERGEKSSWPTLHPFYSLLVSRVFSPRRPKKVASYMQRKEMKGLEPKMEFWSFFISFVTLKGSSFHGLSEATSYWGLFPWRLTSHGLASIPYAVFNFHKIKKIKQFEKNQKWELAYMSMYPCVHYGKFTKVSWEFRWFLKQTNQLINQLT